MLLLLIKKTKTDLNLFVNLILVYLFIFILRKNSILSNCQLLANLPIFVYLYYILPESPVLWKSNKAFLWVIITVIIFVAASLTFCNAEGNALESSAKPFTLISKQRYGNAHDESSQLLRVCVFKSSARLLQH